mgnify:CR=1 FL=1
MKERNSLDFKPSTPAVALEMHPFYQRTNYFNNNDNYKRTTYHEELAAMGTEFYKGEFISAR